MESLLFLSTTLKQSTIPCGDKWGNSGTGLRGGLENQICEVWEEGWDGGWSWRGGHVGRNNGVHTVNDVPTRWWTRAWAELGLPAALTDAWEWLQLGRGRTEGGWRKREKYTVGDAQLLTFVLIFCLNVWPWNLIHKIKYTFLDVRLWYVKTYLFDKNIIIRIINVEAIFIFDPWICDVTSIITTASLWCTCSECQRFLWQAFKGLIL